MATVDSSNAPQPGLITRLMDDLIPLGEKLPESHKPSPATVPLLLAGLLYWLETGSMEPPKIETASPTVVTTKDAEIAELKAQLQAAQTAAANAADPVAPSPVAPTLPPNDAAPVATPPVASPAEVPSTAPQPGASVPNVSEVPSVPAS